MGAWVLSRFSCVQLFTTPWTVAHQAPLSMGFPRQERWTGLPYRPPWEASVYLRLKKSQMITAELKSILDISSFPSKSNHSPDFGIHQPHTHLFILTSFVCVCEQCRSFLCRF